MILLDVDANGQGTSNRDAQFGGPHGHGLADAARLLSQRPAERPAAERDTPAERLAKAAVTACIVTKDGLDAELFNAVRLGLMVSSGRPGVKRVAFVFTDRTNSDRRMECSLLTRVDGDAVVVLSDCGGTARQIARVAVSDPAGPDAVHVAAQRYLLETADGFARAGAR